MAPSSKTDTEVIISVNTFPPMITSVSVLEDGYRSNHRWESIYTERI